MRIPDLRGLSPRLAARQGPLVVLNDEAHHTHDEESEWNETIRRLHADVPGGLANVVDQPEKIDILLIR